MIFTTIFPIRMSLSLLVSLLVCASTFLSSSAAPPSSRDPSVSDISVKAWTELGRGIGQENLGDRAGAAISSNAEGTIVAVGSPLHGPEEAGRVRVYRYDENSNGWKRIGVDLVGKAYENFGAAVSLSVSGDYLAIGAPKCSTLTKIEAGCVTVYELDDGFDGPNWTKLGSTIEGTDTYQHFGSAVDIHAIYTENNYEDYEKVQFVVGAPGALNSLNEKVGRVYFYELIMNANTDVWENKSTNSVHDYDLFVGEGTPESMFGSSVSFSLDDNLIYVGAPKYSTDKHPARGRAYLFSLDGDDKWSPQLTQYFVGEKAGDECGTSVSITLRGNYVGYGCPKAGREDGSIWEPNVGNTHVYWLGKDVNVTTDEETLMTSIIAENEGPIWGENVGDESGTAIALGVNHRSINSATFNADDLYVAIGAPKNNPDIHTRKAGHVRVYHLNKNFEWLRANLDIDGNNSLDALGSSVDISFDGHRVFSGAPGKSAYVKIYELKYTEAPSLRPTTIPTQSPTPRPPTTKYKPTRPTNEMPSGVNKGIKRPVSPFLVTIAILVFAPGTLYLIHRGVKYYRGRSTYRSEFGVDTNVVNANNDLELTPTPNNLGTQAETHDVI